MTYAICSGSRKPEAIHQRWPDLIGTKVLAQIATASVRIDPVLSLVVCAGHLANNFISVHALSHQLRGHWTASEVVVNLPLRGSILFEDTA